MLLCLDTKHNNTQHCAKWCYTWRFYAEYQDAECCCDECLCACKVTMRSAVDPLSAQRNPDRVGPLRPVQRHLGTNAIKLFVAIDVPAKAQWLNTRLETVRSRVRVQWPVL